MDNEQQILGLCWFQPEQWARLLEISEDAEQLEDTYEEWKKRANKAIQDFHSSGKKIQKVKIDLEELLSWCNEKGISVNGGARAQYAADVLLLRQRNKKP
ncbi:hypothetical protein [Thiomicrorhabdus sp. Milos-T2]|uniref:hypothetical protein n=1 Tax=Thiomicrorhabdus sp. Milos-T2 TaxID=90814 RepID=UPI000494ADFE|nr:hypothetical protein [Thiomicrorhabdus sp. Milos-T2]